MDTSAAEFVSLRILSHESGAVVLTYSPVKAGTNQARRMHGYGVTIQILAR